MFLALAASALRGGAQTTMRVGVFPNITHAQTMVGKANWMVQQGYGSAGESAVEQFQRLIFKSMERRLQQRWGLTASA